MKNIQGCIPCCCFVINPWETVYFINKYYVRNNTELGNQTLCINNNILYCFCLHKEKQKAFMLKLILILKTNGFIGLFSKLIVLHECLPRPSSLLGPKLLLGKARSIEGLFKTPQKICQIMSF